MSAVRQWTGTRALGFLLMGVWILSGLAVAYHLVADFEAIRSHAGALLRGMGVTLTLVGVSMVLGAALSVPVAFGRMSGSPLWGRLAYGYVYFFRGTPLIAQAFLVYYGSGSFKDELDAVGLWWVFRDAFACAVIVFTLNTAAYQAEILRGAIESVPRGQHEGCHALGLSKHTAFWRVILPQALVIALRPYGNEIILLLKGSAIAAIITVFDLMGETRRAFSRTFDYNTYILAAILYLVTVEALRRLWDRFEVRLTRHLRPRSG